MTSPSPAAATCLGYLAAFAAGAPDEIAAHVSDDFVNEHTAALGTGCVGKETYRDRLPGFLASMPELRYEVEEVIEDPGTEADGRVWVAYTLHAAIDDRPIAVRGVMRFTVAGGLITRRVDHWDSLVFQRQAGLA